MFVTGIQNTGQPIPIIKTSKSPWFVNETNNKNTNRFRDQIAKDYEPADGWVLVQRDFGDIGSTTTPPRAVDYPYFFCTINFRVSSEYLLQ